MTTILIVDDYPIFIDGFRALLEGNEKVKIGFEALTGKEAITIALRERPDVIFLDISLPDMTGIEVCTRIKEIFPEQKIISFTMHDDQHHQAEMRKAGVNGYLLKNSTGKEIHEAIETVMRGEEYFSSKLTAPAGATSSHGIKILAVDDHKVLLDGIKTLFEKEPDIEITHEALNGKTAIETAKTQPIDLILLDINLPDISGFDVCKEVKAFNENIRIIALTMHGEAGYINKMLKSGVDGYILKNTGKDEMIKAVRAVMSGDRYFSKEVTDSLLMGTPKKKQRRMTDFIQKLTRREKEVLKLIVEECTTDEIAAKLFLASTTVISHRKSLLRKLNAKNVAGLVKKAFEFGLLEDEDDF